jgi:hypothetical protein
VKAIFGVLALVVALAVVATVAKRQLQSTGNVVAHGLSATPSAEASAPALGQQARAVEERVRSDTERALQQGAQRNESADPR